MPVLQIKIEKFPTIEIETFQDLWHDHGLEVAKQPMQLDLIQYYRIEADNRLVWIVARDNEVPIGYSCHVIYYDRHFCKDKIAADDIWYVKPQYRKCGIGKALKETGLIYLKELKVLRTYDLIRNEIAADLMIGMGYSKWGIRWVKNL